MVNQKSDLVLSVTGHFCDNPEVYLLLNDFIFFSTASTMTSMGVLILKLPWKELVRIISENLISSCPFMML